MTRLTTLLATLFCTASLTQAADQHALLIGVGAYKGAKPLDGPPNDVAAIRTLLLGKYHYNPLLVHTLVDQQATKQAILQAMQNLVNEVKPGDYVFFYYSGHGTSFYGTKAFREAIPEDTGASLPVDFDMSTVEKFRKTVLLGRELRPFFKELDEKAQVFAIYDSCYSQDAMKSVSQPAGTPKYVRLSPLVEGATKGDLDDAEQSFAKKTDTQGANKLPYQHLIALSAAKRDQPAVDLDAALVKRNPDATIDHFPHGQLTNALLQGLRGAADKNHDGIITHQELYNYVNEVSAGSWRHNPKLLVSADSDSALFQSAFDGKDIKLDAGCHRESARQPRVSVPSDMLTALGSGFISVVEGWDVKAVARENGYLLYDAGGIQINNDPLPRSKALDRLRAEPVLEQLSELRYCQQNFDTQLYLDPDDLGKYTSSQQIEFAAKVEHSAYLLVIDIDQEGGITVIYADAMAASQKKVLTKTGVVSPFGVELIKAFAFETKPAGFDQFVPPPGKEIYLLPGDPAMSKLLQMLTPDTKGRSETRIQITTSPN